MFTTIARPTTWAASLVALALLAFSLPATAQQIQLRWVHGPTEPGNCGIIAGYANLHAAVASLNPAIPAIIYVAANYQHHVPAGANPTLLINQSRVASSDGLSIMGGVRCQGGEIQMLSATARSTLSAINGNSLILIENAPRVEIERIELRGVTSTPSVSSQALTILGAGREQTTVVLSRLSVRDNQSSTHGPIFVRNAYLIIEGSHFFDNEGESGGAIYIARDAEVVVRESPGHGEFVPTRFENNSAVHSGGAIFMSRQGASNPGSRLTVIAHRPANEPGVVFIGNQAGGKGGAIEAGTQMSLDIIGSVLFENNQAQQGGAVAMYIDSATATSARLMVAQTPDGRRPQFIANRATIHGGAIHCSLNDAAARNRPAIDLGAAEFRHNEAVYRGGAIHSDACRIDSIPGTAPLHFTANRVTFGRAHGAADPEPRGGGALFLTRATVTLGADGDPRPLFGANRVERLTGFWGRECGTQYCILRGLAGGAVMLFDGAGHFYNATFADNAAPSGGAIAAVDASLTVDRAGSGCDQVQGCSLFLRNLASGAAYIQSEASAGRGRRGYGAAIAVRNDRADPTTGLHRNVRIQRTRFSDNGTSCPPGMNCAQDPERLLRGRVIQANVHDASLLIVRGNLFAGNTLPGDPATSTAQADDAEVSLYRRPPSSGAHRAALLAANTFWKTSACEGAPWLVDARDSTGQAGRIDVAANLLLGCSGGRIFTQQSQTSFGVYACNISPIGAPSHAVVQGHNQLQPVTAGFFVNAAAGDFRLSDGPLGNLATDVCGTTIAGESIVSLLQSLPTDLAGQPRPRPYGAGVIPQAGDWDVGAFERQRVLVDSIFSSRFN